jgi:hypothetical protein
MTKPIRRYKIIEICDRELLNAITLELSMDVNELLRLASLPVQAQEDFTVNQLEIIASVLNVKLIDLFSDEYIEWRVNHWFERFA